MLQSSIYEEIDPAKKKGHTIFHGLKSSISAIAVHPKKPILAIAGSEGFVLLWDYMKKGDPLFHNYEFIPKDPKPIVPPKPIRIGAGATDSVAGRVGSQNPPTLSDPSLLLSYCAQSAVE